MLSEIERPLIIGKVKRPRAITKIEHQQFPCRLVLEQKILDDY